jgi:hypothetical protein
MTMRQNTRPGRKPLLQTFATLFVKLIPPDRSWMQYPEIDSPETRVSDDIERKRRIHEFVQSAQDTRDSIADT